MTSADPKGEVIPTSEVRELMFSKHIIKAQHHQTSTTRSVQVGSLGSAFTGGLKKDAQKVTKPGQGVTTTIVTVYPSYLATISTRMKAAVAAATAEFSSDKDSAVKEKIPAIGYPVMPSSLLIQGGNIKTTMNIAELILSDSPAGKVELFKGGSNTTTKKFWGLVDTALAQNLSAQIDVLVKDWVLAMASNGVTHAQRQKALSGFNQALSGRYKVAVKGTTSVKTHVNVPQDTSVQTPVFPVSDDRGYEVIGSYRYGRGVSIDADGVFDRLHRADPLTLLDKKTVDALVDLYVRGMRPVDWFSKYVGTSKTSGGSGKAQSPTNVAQTEGSAATKVETEVLRQLRKVLSDQQILDLGFATIGKNPNMLTLNMRNWFADKGKEGIHKLPINNAAYSLADLTVHTSKRGCDCKSAEADVLLAAAGQTDFVQFTDPGTSVPQGYPTGTEDKATQWLVTSAARASVTWKQSQDALRGTVIDRNTSSIVSSLLGAGEQLADTKKKLGAQAESLGDAAALRANTAATAVRQAFGEEPEEEGR